MNLSGLLTDLSRRLRYGTTPQAVITARLTAFLNETHRELLALPGMEHLRDDVMPVTAYANVARSGLPPTVARIRGVTDRGNNVRLEQVPLSELRLIDPAQAFAGSYPCRYAFVGNQAVVQQPGTTGLWAASTSAADTTQNVYVESVVQGGYPQNYVSGGTLLTGATRVQIGTRTDAIEVTRFYVDAPGAGFISLYDAAASGNTLATIPIGQTFSRYAAVEWWPIPSVDTTEYLDYTRAIFDLVNGTDEPLLPVDFHYLVELGARVKEYELIDDSRVARAQADYERGQTKLRAWVLNDGDRVGSVRSGVSSLRRDIRSVSTFVGGGSGTSLPDPVTPAHGGTGVTSLAANGVVIGRGTANVTVTTVGTSGQLLTSNGTGNDPTFQTLALPNPANFPGAVTVTGAATFLSTVGITGALTQTGAATFLSTVAITGALTQTGAATFYGNVLPGANGSLNLGNGSFAWARVDTYNLNAYGNIAFSGTLAQTGAATFFSTASVTGVLSPLALVDISGASAGQIKFPATQVASTNANTLDDYEEGTWTPTDGSGAAIVLTITSATYTKIGRVVWFQMQVTYAANADGTAAKVTGLPFTVASNGAASLHTNAAATLGYGLLNTGAITISILTTAATAVTNATLTGASVIISGVYAV